jgi:hypothetical protein
MKCIIIITIGLNRQAYSGLMSQSPRGPRMLCVLSLVTQGSPKTALKYFCAKHPIWGKIRLGCWDTVRLKNFEDFSPHVSFPRVGCRIILIVSSGFRSYNQGGLSEAWPLNLW